MGRMNIGVLASGRGSNFQAILDAVDKGFLDVNIALLICNKKDAFAFERAKKHGIDHEFIDHKGKKREEFERELVSALRAKNVELVVLAGFMRLLTPYFVGEFRGRIVNIHPALLPSFPGAHAHRDAIEYGVGVSGCTVHIVDEGEDTGPIVIQKAVALHHDDTEESLSARILEWEHRLFPLAIKLFAEGLVKVEGRKVVIEGLKGEITYENIVAQMGYSQI
jgi:phosphoribosylglycinamide formyltransferase-1